MQSLAVIRQEFEDKANELFQQGGPYQFAVEMGRLSQELGASSSLPGYLKFKRSKIPGAGAFSALPHGPNPHGLLIYAS